MTTHAIRELTPNVPGRSGDSEMIESGKVAKPPALDISPHPCRSASRVKNIEREREPIDRTPAINTTYIILFTRMGPRSSVRAPNTVFSMSWTGVAATRSQQQTTTPICQASNNLDGQTNLNLAGSWEMKAAGAPGEQVADRELCDAVNDTIQKTLSVNYTFYCFVLKKEQIDEIEIQERKGFIVSAPQSYHWQVLCCTI